MSEDLEAYAQANEEQARILHEDSINELRSCAAKPGRNKERYYRDLYRDWSSVARGTKLMSAIREAAALDGIQFKEEEEMSYVNYEQYMEAHAEANKELTLAAACLHRCADDIVRAAYAYEHRHNYTVALKRYAEAIKDINAASAACKRVAAQCLEASEVLKESEKGK